MTTLPARASYTAAECEFFARYAETRARFRPTECTADAPRCWVKEGPPAAGKNTHCLGCGGIPKMYGRAEP